MTDTIVVTPVIPSITVAAPGPQGPAGAFSPSDIAYTHTQAVSSATWTINHNLGFNPVAVVLDSGGTQCEGAISYPTLNQMVITFTGAFTGVAYIVQERKMARKFLVSIDLNKNELQNAVIQNLATAPGTPSAGQVYYNTVDNQLYIYNGTRWEVAGNAVMSGTLAARPAAATVDTGTIYYATDTYLFYYSDGSTWTQTNAFGLVTAQTTYSGASADGTATTYSHSDHTHGTPALGTATPIAINGAAGNAGSASTPSKNDHVHAFTPAQDLSMATFKITSLGTPASGSDAATKDYVDGVAQGLDIKASCRVATAVAGTLATSFAAGQVVDGITLVTADRILIKNQVTGADNGIYTVNVSGAPTRSTDADTSAEVTNGMFTFIEEGTINGSTSWVLTTPNPIVLGTTALTFTQFSGAGTYTASNGVLLTGQNFTFAPRANYGLQTGASGAEIKLATTSGLNVSSDLAVGAGNGISVLTSTVAIDSAVVVSKYAVSIGDGSATSYTVTHNLNTQDVIVSLYAVGSPYAEVEADISHTTVNTITVAFSVAPTLNQYRVVVHA